MDNDVRPDVVSRMLNDFVRDVSQEVVTPVFSPESVSSRRVRGGSRRRTISIALTVVAGIAVAVVVVTYGPRNSANHHLVPATGPKPGPEVIALPVDGGQPQALLASGGELWVGTAAPDHRSGWLYEFEAHSGQLVASIRLASGAPFQIADGAGAVWLRTQKGESATDLVRIDSPTHRVTADIPLHFDGGLAVSKTAVWTVDGSQALDSIDPTTATIAFTRPLPGGLYPPTVVVSGPLGVFLGSPYDGSILRVDEQARTESLLTRVSGKVDQIVEAAGGDLWVNTGTTLVPVSANGGQAGQPVPLDRRVLGLAYDGLSLWVTTDQGPFEVDPASGTIIPVEAPGGAKGLTDVSSDLTTGETWAVGSPPRPSVVRLGSTAENRVTVPDVVGMTPADAAGGLQSVGLYNSIDDLDCSGLISRAKVVAENPTPASQVARGTRVSLQVSCR